MSVNVANIEKDIREARQRLRQAIDAGDADAEIQIRADISRLGQNLTQARRELRNFARTGEKEVSVL